MGQRTECCEAHVNVHNAHSLLVIEVRMGL